MKLALKAIFFMYLFSCGAFAYSTQEHITLTHPNIEAPLTFHVQLPNSYATATDKSYPVMFNFHHYSNTYLSGMHDWMSHNAEWPWLETIIITPQRGTKAGMLFDSSGQTTPLLDFFAEQLFPAIDKAYRTNSFRMISGFRIDGSIVLSALLNKPDLFNGYIAVSPELKNDMAGILSSAADKLKKLTDKPRFLLVSHGSTIKEEHQQSLYKQLHQQLQQHAPTQLDWHYRRFHEHSFMSLPIISVVTGIEKLFHDIHTGLAPDSPVSKAGLDAISQHYRYLSEEKYGFEVSPKKSQYALAEATLALSPDKGISMYQALTSHYPDDAYSHHYLAAAFAKTGDWKNAVKHQKVAAKLAEQLLTWHKKRHQRFLSQYQEKLKAATP